MRAMGCYLGYARKWKSKQAPVFCSLYTVVSIARGYVHADRDPRDVINERFLTFSRLTNEKVADRYLTLIVSIDQSTKF